MTHVEIRPARPEELPAVRDLFVEVVRDIAVYSERARESELGTYTLQRIESLHRENPRFVLVAAGPAGLDGFLVSRDDDDLLWLSWFGVREAARGRRLSARLLSYLRTAAREMGYWKIWCDARDTNAPSIRALETAGFRQVCRLGRHWFGQDYLLFETFLDEGDSVLNAPRRPARPETPDPAR